MATKGQEIKIGPWPRGINQREQPLRLADDELVVCQNFDVDNSGILLPRRNIRQVALTASRNCTIIGQTNLTGESTPRVVMSAYNITLNQSQMEFFKDPSGTDKVLGNTVSGAFSAVVPYLNELYFVPASINGQAGFGHKTSMTASSFGLIMLAAMPKGDQAFMLKDRMFIVHYGTSTIYYSKVSDLSVWGSPDGGLFKVAPADNNPITKVLVVNNQLVIFKARQTFIFTFTANPSSDGSLRQVSTDQGAYDAVLHNNEVYLFNEQSIFKFVNGFFTDIGAQLALPKVEDMSNSSSIGAKLGTFENMLVVGRLATNKFYVMNLDTGAWSTWVFDPGVNLTFTNVYRSVSDTKGTCYFFGKNTSIWYMKSKRELNDAVDSDGVYNNSLDFRVPAYSITTKDYDFDDGTKWKRIYSWFFDNKLFGVGDATTQLIINDTGTLASSDVDGLLGSHISARFRKVAFVLSSIGGSTLRYVNGIKNTQPQYLSSVGEQPLIGMKVYSIKAIIGAKASIDK